MRRRPSSLILCARIGQKRRPPVSSFKYSPEFVVPQNTHERGLSITRWPYGGRKRSVVREIKALVREVSLRDILSSSAHSISQAPRVCIAASLLPRSAISSVNHGSKSARKADD